MKDLTSYLNAVKTKHGIKSNLQLSMKIGVSPAYIDGIMKGRIPGDDICIRIAELSGDRPEIVIALAHKTRASSNSKKYWDHILKAVTAATFSILLALPSLIFVQLCILCKII